MTDEELRREEELKHEKETREVQQDSALMQIYCDFWANSSGYYDYLNWLKSVIKAREWLRSHDLEECPKCKGDPNKTMGMCPCTECGLIGLSPWGG